MSASKNPSAPKSFAEIFARELDDVSASRESRGVRIATAKVEAPPKNPSGAAESNDPHVDERTWSARAEALELVGIAFSGGGIRSATFNLGFAQALAKRGVLRRADFLSTVSGGGYIGSWLQAWIHRDGLKRVEEELKKSVGCETDPSHDCPTEPQPIAHLRRYSNYLTPKLGFFSADTWSFLSNYLRNSILNSTVLALFLTTMLLLPRLAVDLAVLLGLRTGGWKELSSPTFTDDDLLMRFEFGQPDLIAIVLLAVNIAFSIVNYVASRDDSRVAVGRASAVLGRFRWPFWRRPAFTLTILFVTFLLSSILVSDHVAGFLRQFRWARSLFSSSGFALDETLAALLVGTPVAATVLGLGGIFLAGIFSRIMSDQNREWMSRGGAFFMIYLTAWSALFAATFFGPRVVDYFVAFDWRGAIGGAVAAGWIGAIFGVIGEGRSETAGRPNESGVKRIIAGILPHFVVGGLVVILSWFLHRTVLGLAPDVWTCCATKNWPIAAASAIAAIGFSFAIDVNVFSMHTFYRNRLMRCYFRASNRDRRIDPFTGLDGGEDIALSNLVVPQNHGEMGPLPIVNTALNLVSGKNLAWQQRKAASFTFTARHIGFALPMEFSETGAFEKTEAFRSLDDIEKTGNVPTLGLAMAISGAAASPNMGWHSSPPTAFLMTFFDVRLGWWIGNPKSLSRWSRLSPRFGLLQLILELLGQSNESGNYVYLSDGGHFENLGIYELVRRRTKWIFVGDAGQDAAFFFEDLGNAVRKCRSDFGAEIEIDTTALSPDPETRRSNRPFAFGTVRYRDGFVGKILYVKPGLMENLPTDVLNYSLAEPDFPHQPTSDQWFDEAQFESYRRLGYAVGSAALAFGDTNPDQPFDPEKYFAAVAEKLQN